MINNQTNNRADLNSAVALGQALQRLEKNEDFLAVIKDDYIMRTLIVESQGMLDQSPPMRQEALEKILEFEKNPIRRNQYAGTSYKAPDWIQTKEEIFKIVKEALNENG